MTAIENSLPSGLTRVEHNPDVLAVERSHGHYQDLPFNLKHILIRAAATSPCAEICGFITNRMSPYFVLNSAEEPKLGFYMAPADYARAIELIASSGDEIIGVFHSHPSGDNWPSQNDMRGWPNPDLNWRYFIVTINGVFEYVRI